MNQIWYYNISENHILKNYVHEDVKFFENVKFHELNEEKSQEKQSEKGKC